MHDNRIAHRVSQAAAALYTQELYSHASPAGNDNEASSSHQVTLTQWAAVGYQRWVVERGCSLQQVMTALGLVETDFKLPARRDSMLVRTVY